jgi:Domain of unknown function (DUF4286)
MTPRPESPVSYEVSITVEPPFVDALERYMPGHIAGVIATGVFTSASFARLSPGRYRARYDAPGQRIVDRYIAEDAPRLRADFVAHFPVGVTFSREIWTEIHRHPGTTE